MNVRCFEDTIYFASFSLIESFAVLVPFVVGLLALIKVEQKNRAS